MRQHTWLWFCVTVFFFLLALDERFMFHEQIKEFIIFSLHNPTTASRWLYELPVMAGACVGLYIVYVLWPHIPSASRTLLLCATGLGFLSVVFDIQSAGVLWEECFKLIAELLVALAFLRKLL